MRIAAVVLAGGASRRFGSDKLAAGLDQQSLLDHTLAGLPAAFAVVVVGPPRPLARTVTFAREDPPGGGPSAGLVAGLRAALETGPEAVVVLPGDAPAAGRATTALLTALGDRPAAVGVDATGQVQPLQLALRPAAARDLIDRAGPTRGAGESARRLVAGLDPVRVSLPPEHAFDVDTPDQLLVWRLHTGPAVTRVVAAIAARRTTVAGRPVVVAVDGPSGAGKSTLAAALALRTGGATIDGDDFYSSGMPGLGAEDRDRMSDAAAAARVIDWRRLRTEALTPLRRGVAATYRPYDWAADDGRLAGPRSIQPGDPVILEGVYSARPELADLVDLSVHVAADPGVRAARLAERADDPSWAAFWERAEQHYFGSVRRPDTFDLRLTPSLTR